MASVSLIFPRYRSVVDKLACRKMTLEMISTRLYAKYKEWCQEGGNRALSRNKFYDQLMIGYPQVTEKLKPIADNPVRQRCFAGICIRDEAFSA